MGETPRLRRTGRPILQRTAVSTTGAFGHPLPLEQGGALLEV